jgi:autotransporter-associated beta strand protein
MKPIASHHSTISAACTALALCITAVEAGTTTSTFSFQQGDLKKDGVAHGTGASYAGALDGHLQDLNTTGALSAGATLTIGNQFQSGSPNGRNFVGLFAYNLTELNDFITANTSASSTATVTSVSFRLVASGNTSGGAHAAIALYRTDPFTSAATWPTTDGSTAWTNPYQDLAAPNNTVQFGFTGGGSDLTDNLGTTSPSTASKTAGSPLEWTTSANFITALNGALARPDKTLYLMAARGLQNSDGRVPVHSRNSVAVDDRPELVITVAVSTVSDWTGAVDTSWTSAGNWTSAPGAGDNVRFNNSSTSNLATTLDQDFNLNGIALTDPAGPVSIGGANSITLGSGGLDLSAATQNLTITAPLVLDATQIWSIASGRTLGIGGAITGSGNLTVFGEGMVSLGASGILPNGAGAGNLTVDGVLDLNGTSQSINALNGSPSGIIDNSADGDSVLAIGNNNASGTFTGVLLNTGIGTLAVQKTGSGSLTLSGPSSYSGGFTNDGTGNVAPNHNGAFGNGPVVSNAGQIYATASTIFSNTLDLNNSTLRIGGGNNRTINWNGPVTATGTSGISADGGTAGITLGSTLDITGATFNSFANNTTNTISGDISGTGGNLNVTGGTLQLLGTATHTGTTTLSGGGALRLQPAGTISGNVTINGSGNFVVRNTVGWTYNGTITGDGTGQINLNTGTDATLAGDISGVANINTNNIGTDATISGIISGAANLSVQSGSILTLSGANDYSGNTTIGGGTLALGAANVLPDTTPVTIGNATLDAATFTDTAGTLDVTNAASTINLGAGAALVFDPSDQVDWTGGTLNITGIFVPGVSLNFGNSGGLTDDQLLQISAAGYTAFDLDANGFLTATEALGFAAWQSANGTAGALDEDHDNDGVSNGIEFFLGGGADTTGFTELPGVVADGGALSVTWTKAGDYDGVYGTDFVVETSETLSGTWSPEALSPAPGATVVITGNEVKFTFPAGTKNFARLKVSGP